LFKSIATGGIPHSGTGILETTTRTMTKIFIAVVLLRSANPYSESRAEPMAWT